MVESKKDKRVRFFLILFFVSLTIVGFIYQNKKTNVHKTISHPLAVVVQKGNTTDVNPIVGIYEYRDNQHVLALYEVEVNNNFHFKTVHAKTLKDSPEQLAIDSENGIWMDISNEWYYFDQRLEMLQRNSKYRIPKEDISYTVETTNGQNVVSISPDKRIIVGQDEEIHEVLSLFYDDTVWLVLTDKGVKISIIETK